MNTRKANLRKLRLPSTETKNGLRNGHRRATSTISNYFSTDPDNALEEEEEERMDKDVAMECSEPMPSPINHPPPLPSPYSPPMPSPIEKLQDEPQEKIARSTRTKLKTFFPQDKRMNPAAHNPLKGRKTNDFETPSAKIIKTAPKIKEKTKPKPKTKAQSKKQQTIKSAFFQNEQLFSDVTAQHCLVDNINPEEMQLALALSRSELEVSGSPVENKSTETNEGIRDKLKKFGFQVTDSEEINYESVYKLSKGKNKWANKFTPLTLRNSKRQLDKVNEKIEEILKANLSPYNSPHDEELVRVISLESPMLQQFVATDRIIQSDSSGRLDIVDFYVLSLFEPSRTKAGYLLKDVRRIPGRDRSPVNTKSSLTDVSTKHKTDSQSNISTEKIISSLKENYKMDEEDTQLKSPAIKRVRADESTSPIKCVLFPNMDTSSDELIEFSQQSLPSTISEPYDSKQRRRKTTSVLDLQNTTIDSVRENTYSNKCEKESSANFREETFKQFNTTSVHATTSATSTCSSENGIGSQMKIKPIRATSPDIFADSDVEMETDDDCEMKTLKFTSSEDKIETYEIFSSDEVKTSSDVKVDSSHKIHNSLLATIDLTQQGSETSSQDSLKLIPTSESITPYQDHNDDLPSTSFGSQLNENTLTRSRSFKETNSSFEKSISEKSTEIKRITGFSFGSTASGDLSKSTSFNKTKEEENSIDLTQIDDDDQEEDIDCIVLSDDEVNYSIRKADKSLHLKDEKSLSDNSFKSTDSKDKQEFSFVDFVAATQPLPATQSEEFELDFMEKSNNSASSLDMDLSKRSDFGILDEQSPFKTPTRTPKKTPWKTPQSTPTKSPKSPKSSTSSKCRRALSESFLSESFQESSAPLKRFSSSNNKFKEFTKSDEESFSDLDDIDKLIYGSPTKKIYKKPTGLTQLLTGAINERIVTPEKSDKEVPQEFNFNGRTYLVRSIDVAQRPNFATMDESTLLDNLYRYGIKRLKRKQAEKILEYIYNQTHPRLVDEADLPSEAISDTDIDLPSQGVGCESDDEIEMSEPAVSLAGSKFNLKDCWGHILISDTIPSMEIKDEQYFFQTNTSKKISTALLPFHTAWYNLLKSNTRLHEAILFYEPIDLQEVYLFFKSLGYRYDPKAIKYFFDSRSIIFRYDVNKSENSAGNRHVRKKRQKIKKKI